LQIMIRLSKSVPNTISQSQLKNKELAPELNAWCDVQGIFFQHNAT